MILGMLSLDSTAGGELLLTSTHSHSFALCLAFSSHFSFRFWVSFSFFVFTSPPSPPFNSALEELQQEGKVCNIGVSNYTVRHMQELMAVCVVPPFLNQVEFHPLCQQTEVSEYCVLLCVYVYLCVYVCVCVFEFGWQRRDGSGVMAEFGFECDVWYCSCGRTARNTACCLRCALPF